MAFFLNPFTGNFDLVRDNPLVSTSSADSGSVALSLTNSNQTFIVSGATNFRSFITTLIFGSSAPPNGTEATLIGGSDTNYVLLQTYDVAKGHLLNGECYLYLNQTIKLKYVSSIDRWVEISRSH